jgi:hypothetical protein
VIDDPLVVVVVVLLLVRVQASETPAKKASLDLSRLPIA